MSRAHALDGAALVAATVTALGWGLTGPVIRLLPPVSPVSVTAARLLLALIVTAPVLFVLYRRGSGVWRVWRQPLAYGLALLLAGYYLFATAAFQLAPVAEVALLLSTPPLYVVILHRCAGQAAARTELGGALLALSGLAWLLAPQWSLAQPGFALRLVGDGLALAASLLVAVYALLYRSAEARGCAPQVGGVMVMTFALGAAALVAVHILTTGKPYEGFHAAVLPLWLVLGILCTALPSLGYGFASRRLPAVVTTSVSLLLPLLAAGFAFALLGERVAPRALPGAVLVLAGIALILRRSRAA